MILILDAQTLKWPNPLLASWMPFAQAAKMLERLLGVQVSEPTVRRQTEAAGAQVEAVQTAQAFTSESEGPVELGAARQVISADGAYVPLRKRGMG